MTAQNRQESRSSTRHGEYRAYAKQSPRAVERVSEARTPAERRPRRSYAPPGREQPARYYDSSWVRSARSQLEFLASRRTIDTETVPMVEFAIRWAPFGGASPGDLLVTFGIDRRRFMTLIEKGLCIRRTDDSEERRLKRRLSDALTSAWCGENAGSTGVRHR
ncbi:hypothetical protein [Nocardia nova]|uniref:hypothetical protein n=2 Tax=Nocardia nova TaxID=37330 RepID=UPI0011B0F37A